MKTYSLYSDMTVAEFNHMRALSRARLERRKARFAKERKEQRLVIFIAFLPILICYLMFLVDPMSYLW